MSLNELRPKLIDLFLSVKVRKEEDVIALQYNYRLME